jgi:hypothetical protein
MPPGTNDGIRRECSFFHIPLSILHPRRYSFDKTSCASPTTTWRAILQCVLESSQLASTGGQRLIDRRLPMTTATRSIGFNSSSITEKVTSPPNKSPI